MYVHTCARNVEGIFMIMIMIMIINWVQTAYMLILPRVTQDYIDTVR